MTTSAVEACEKDGCGVSRGFFLLIVHCSHPLLGCRDHEQAVGTDHRGASVQNVQLQPSLYYPVREGSQTLPTAAGLLLLLGARSTPKTCLGVKMK